MSTITAMTQDERQMEKAARAVWRKHVRSFAKALLTPACRAMIENDVRQRLVVLQWITPESKRKKRTKRYEQFVENMLAGVAEIEEGSFSRLTPEGLTAMESQLRAVTDHMSGKSSPTAVDPHGFIAMQESLFAAPKRRGRPNEKVGDEAFQRTLRGDDLGKITRDLDPDGYKVDRANAMHKMWRRIQRRRKQTGML